MPRQKRRLLPPFQRSLRYTLTAPYVALVLLLTAVIGTLSYWAGTRMVASLSERVMVEMVERISQAVDRHMVGSGAVLEVAFPEGMAAPEDLGSDLPALRTRFWMATALNEGASENVYFGNLRGQGLYVRRTAPRRVELRIKTQPAEHRRFYSFEGINGELNFTGTENAFFDPRQRPWFLLGQKTQSHTWTSVYVNFATTDLVVTRARRVLSANGRFDGVVATDVFLGELNQFITRLALNTRGRAFLLEPSGELIAASGLPNVRLMPDGKAARVTAESSGDPIIQASFARMRALPGLAAENEPTRTMELEDSTGETVQVAYKRIVDKAGLDWIAAVAVPRSAILGEVTRNVSSVVVTGLLATLAAIFIGLMIFGRVARDIAQLSHAVGQARHGEMGMPVNANRSDEIGELARSFHQLRRDLFTDRLTGVGNRNALQHQLALLLQTRNGEAAPPFALLFIDLDRFKPLNDAHGHDNGDLALIEIARRIQGEIRPCDRLVRLGGDEFVILLPGVGEALELQQWREHIRAAIERPLDTLHDLPPHVRVSLGASIGLAIYPEDGDCADTLLKRADRDMYREKDATRDTGKM